MLNTRTVLSSAIIPLLALIACLLFASDVLMSADCPVVTGVTPTAIVAYLGRNRAFLDPKCVVATIQQLGQSEDKPAIRTLVEYLDFRRPSTQPELLGIKVADSIPLGDPYPAIAALAEIGNDAVPALLGKLGEPATMTFRANAVVTIIFIKRGIVSRRYGRSATHTSAREIRKGLFVCSRQRSSR